jgi:ABC-type multidrug transport system permease subunit
MAKYKEKFLDFKKILAIMQKNFIVLTRDKTRMIPLLMFPIFMILVFGYTSGNIPKHISTAVILYDTSPLSDSLMQDISSSDVFAVKYVVSTEGEAKKLLDNAKVRAIIIIPPQLEDDIKNGVQTSITIMVDESDSAVASSARQTLNAIVNNYADRLSIQKINELQGSTERSAQALKNYNSNFMNQYGLIATKVAAADTSLTSAKKIIDDMEKGLVASLNPSTLYVPEYYIDVYNYTDTNTNYTFVMLPPGYSAMVSQIAILDKTSMLMGAADKSLNAAQLIAARNSAAEDNLKDDDTYNKNVVLPIKTIEVFTRYDAGNLIRPVVYEEKPAYGTGKRPIDFIIASIIALTIFQGAIMGMGRAIAGEKREGSLTRVFLTPTSNATIITGTLAFYIVFEIIRSSFIVLVSMIFFSIHLEGNILLIGLILLIYAGIATSIGMILSGLVKTEQQFMAMAMLITMPTTFLGGVFFPIQAMPKVFQIIASFLPVTYAGDALRGVMIKGFSINYVIYPLAVLTVFLLIFVSLVFMVFKRDIE